jgi:nucleoid DNA-binding protein
MKRYKIFSGIKDELIKQGANLDERTIAKVFGGLVAYVHRQFSNGEMAILPEIGRIKPVIKGSKNGRDYRTGERIEVPARVGLKFKPSIKSKRALPDKLPG